MAASLCWKRSLEGWRWIFTTTFLLAVKNGAFLADNILFSQCFCFPPFPSSLSLVHDSEGNLCADNKFSACKEVELYSV